MKVALKYIYKFICLNVSDETSVSEMSIVTFLFFFYIDLDPEEGYKFSFKSSDSSPRSGRYHLESNTFVIQEYKENKPPGRQHWKEIRKGAIRMIIQFNQLSFF